MKVAPNDERETQLASYFAKYDPAVAELGKALRAKLRTRYTTKIKRLRHPRSCIIRTVDMGIESTPLSL